jgi:cholesterol transport system auxiliary component
LVSGLLVGCAGPKGTDAPARYDLGTGLVPAPAVPAAGAPVWLAAVNAPSSLEGTHMLYRLDYSNALQPRAYAQARWSMPVPELLAQRLRQQLAQKRVVLNPADGVQSRHSGTVLRLELEDFSQHFATPQQATAQLRLRATLSVWRGGVEHLLDQRTLQATQPCPSADAEGGVRALALATDQVLGELERWLDASAPR